MKTQKYWIAVVSKDHSLRGVSGGYMQVCHGRQAQLQRMKQEDWVVIYSSKLSMEGDQKCQSFTAIGQVCAEAVYQFKMTNDFIPFRRDIKFFGCEEIPILPLIEKLEFIKNKKSWGYPFRLGFFEISENDFNLVSSQMLKHETIRQCI